MIFIAPVASVSVEAKIVQIERQSVFAGKLGERVHEDIVVERNGNRYTVSVDGDYHTACLHPNQRLHEGDMVRLPEGSRVRRTDIHRLRG